MVWKPDLDLNSRQGFLKILSVNIFFHDEYKSEYKKIAKYSRKNAYASIIFFEFATLSKMIQNYFFYRKFKLTFPDEFVL